MSSTDWQVDGGRERGIGQAPASFFEAASRELALTCDVDGKVLWADARASRLFDDVVGASLIERAIPGSDEKLRALLRSSLDGPLEDWEISFATRNRPVTLSLSTSPAPAGSPERTIQVLASLVPESQGAALGQVNAAMASIAALQREAERQKAELLRVNRELLESNRGVITLHAELDEKSDSLRRVGEVRSRVIASVSHEFRTPLNSILGIARLMLDRVDGDLTEEQEKQLRFIRNSAAELSEMVNDLLDLSRLEAGKYHIRPRSFTVENLFGALRGMMRPIVPADRDVRFELDAAPNLPQLDTDEGKISQILRNLVSNAFKFTEQGEVRVKATQLPAQGASGAPSMVVFEVSDTGIGIGADDLERIFDEFVQVESSLQKKVKGSGLGLSVSRKLAETLGGRLTVTSSPGEGSTFRLVVPAVHEEVREMNALKASSETLDPRKAPVLVVEDDRQTLFLYEKYLRGSGFQVIPARNVDDARTALQRLRPAAVVLDVMLEGESTWTFLTELKENPDTAHIPVMVVTVVDREQKARALGADEFWLKPVDGERLRRKLGEMSKRGAVKVLVIDDDEPARYIVRKMLAGTPYTILEASSGEDGVRLARIERPQIIILDFVLGDVTAFDVLDELKIDPVTRNIPVIIQTSKTLEQTELDRLSRVATAVLSKHQLSRELAIARVREALVQAGVARADAPVH